MRWDRCDAIRKQPRSYDEFPSLSANFYNRQVLVEAGWKLKRYHKQGLDLTADLINKLAPSLKLDPKDIALVEIKIHKFK